MRTLLFVLLSLASAAAFAHANGASYLRIVDDRAGPAIAVRWDIAVADLELPLELDRDGDGRWSADEIAARASAIARFASDRIGIRRGGDGCRLSVAGIELRPLGAESYVRLQVDGACPANGRVEVGTNLFFGSKGYSTLLDLVTPAGSLPAVLTMDRPQWSEPAAPSLLATLGQFLREGFRHVLIGYDHVAFLLLLLLPAVLCRSATGWTAATDRRAVTLELLKIVTAFTVAHSITLGLAATGTVRLPVQPIELAIVALVLPVLWMLSRGSGYAGRWMPAASVATAVTGAVWFVGRW